MADLPVTDIKRFNSPHEVVPRNFEENLRFRRALKQYVASSHDNRQMLIDACARDLLFFTAAMVWTYDPKRFPDHPFRPFIPFPYQEDILLEIDAAIGKHDRAYPKSRDMGLSWMPLIACDRRFLFRLGQKFLFISRTEDLVDSADDPDALFPKIDIIHRFLPPFLTADVDRTHLKFFKRSTNSMINGATTTGDAGRGGRCTCIIPDEFGAMDRNKGFDLLSSTSGNTFSRIFVGTPKGQGNAFHKVCTDGNIPRRDVHWTLHPFHRIGLYSCTKNGELQLLDKDFWDTATFGWLKERFSLIAMKMVAHDDELLRDIYPFVRDGKTRSPYYDHECRRMPFPWMQAQELDIDFVGSGSPFYDADLVNEIIGLRGCDPFKVGDLTHDIQTFAPIRFGLNKNGKLSLWCILTVKGRPVLGRRYVISCDISTGSGVSNSCASVWDCMTGEKVASYVRADVRPERFAEHVYALGRWFYDAEVIFEGQGPGVPFGQRLKELRYPAIWFERDDKGKPADHPGLFLNGDSKYAILTEYGRALVAGELVNHDKLSMSEGTKYQFNASQLIEHVDAGSAPDPSGAKKNHGDRWMADALGWFLVRKKLKKKRVEVETKGGYSLAAASEESEYDDEESREDYWA